MNLVQVTDVEDKIDSGYGTEYTYDLANRKITVLDPVSYDRSLTYTNLYGYDALGRNTSITDARGYETDYTYNNAGNILTVSTESQTTQINTYDLAGNLTSTTDGNGNTTTYTYNAFKPIEKRGISRRFFYSCQYCYIPV